MRTDLPGQREVAHLRERGSPTKPLSTSMGLIQQFQFLKKSSKFERPKFDPKRLESEPMAKSKGRKCSIQKGILCAFSLCGCVRQTNACRNRFTRSKYVWGRSIAMARGVETAPTGHRGSANSPRCSTGAVSTPLTMAVLRHKHISTVRIDAIMHMLVFRNHTTETPIEATHNVFFDGVFRPWVWIWISF